MQLLGREVQTKTSMRSLVVVLADSSLSNRSAVVEELRKDDHLAIGCGECSEVEKALSQQIPDLLLLGNLSEISYLEAYRKYSSLYQDLPIILLTKEPTINQFFRDWAVSKGVNDVLSSCTENLYLLREKMRRFAYSELEAKISEIPVTVAPMSLVSEPIQESHSKVSEILNPTLASLPFISSASLTYDRAITMLNEITEFSKKYFGEMVLGNYWKKAYKSSVAEHPWLSCWLIEYNGAISYFSEDIPQEQLTDEQYQSLKLWVSGFLKECDRIIGDYTELLQQKGLSIQINQIISAPNLGIS
jgi:CheY-like chemotaxis protein